VVGKAAGAPERNPEGLRSSQGWIGDPSLLDSAGRAVGRALAKTQRRRRPRKSNIREMACGPGRREYHTSEVIAQVILARFLTGGSGIHGGRGGLLPLPQAVLVSRAKDLRSRVRKLQDSFALPLHDPQSEMTLADWSSQTADRNAKTTSALEVVESHSQSIDFTVHDLAQATAGLRRAIELEISLQGWRERLGTDATRLEVDQS
jgi:hypothetical protein